MKIEFEKQFGKGTDPWYAKAERWAKKQKFPISFSKEEDPSSDDIH